MAYDDIFRPGVYKAWNEAIIKEKKIRVKWQSDYRSKLKKSLLEDGIQHETPELPCTCEDKTTSPPVPQVQMDWPRKGATGTNTIIRVLDTPSDMIQPTPVKKSILYEGISHEGEGRAGYLKRRWQTDPEERFRTHVCTSWKHGWNYGKENELSCKDMDSCNIRKIAFGLE